MACPAPRTGAADRYFCRFDATFDQIGANLERLRAAMGCWGVGRDRLDDIELAVGEALNNVAEHGYGPGGGRVSLFVLATERGIHVRIRDRGRANTRFDQLGWALPAHSVPRATLPEGGFGWHLIRKLAKTVRYRVLAGSNLLCLEFPR